MKTTRIHQLLITLLLSFFFASNVSANNAAIPAFLPMADDVPMSEPMAIDGIWKINTINKRIRIEAGRAYAVDPWLHMFVLSVNPGMVVIQNITENSNGEYIGDDLPLLGKFHGTLQDDGNIKVTVKTSLLPVNYTLIPVDLDNPVSPDPQPETSECAQEVVDPETNERVCLD